jgi:YidC/Oxa1 family membrane protein insertase
MINEIADFFQNLFAPVVNILGAVLLYFHQTLGAPWWLSIVMLTVIVRSLLFPLTVKQVRSMRAMQDLKPQMDRVRAQFKDNPQRQREEMAKVYQEQGVNPLGGCLPILVQMPIFIHLLRYPQVRRYSGADRAGVRKLYSWRNPVVSGPFPSRPYLSAADHLGGDYARCDRDHIKER